MTHPEIALDRILAAAKPLEPEWTPLQDGLGRVLAEDVAASGDWPPFDYSPGHGYAVLTGDLEGAAPDWPVKLKLTSSLVEEDAKGSRCFPGRAVAVAAGSKVPEGAEAVLAGHEVEVQGGAVEVIAPARPGARVEQRCLDIRRGELLLSRGARLRASDLVVLGSQAMDGVRVVRRARVAVAIARAERTPGGAACPAEAHAAPALRAALAGWGAVVQDRGVLPEGEGPIREALAAALSSCDVLVLGGGLAETLRESASAALLGLGLAPEFWGVAIEPGAGLFFGRCKGKPVFGLPGPASAGLLCLEEFVRPALEGLHGMERSAPEYPCSAQLDGDVVKNGARQLYLFGVARRGLDGHRFRPLAAQRLGAVRVANAVARIPIGPTRLSMGSAVTFRFI